MITDMARHNSTENNVPPHSPGSKSLQAFTVDTNCSNNAIYVSRKLCSTQGDKGAVRGNITI